MLGIRPEDLEDASLVEHDMTNRTLVGEAGLREALGSEIVFHVRIDAQEAITEHVRELAEDAGDDRALEDADTPGTELVGRFSPRSQLRTGDRVQVAVDTDVVHFFDPETSDGIYDQNGTPPGGAT